MVRSPELRDPSRCTENPHEAVSVGVVVQKPGRDGEPACDCGACCAPHDIACTLDEIPVRQCSLRDLTVLTRDLRSRRCCVSTKGHVRGQWLEWWSATTPCLSVRREHNAPGERPRRAYASQRSNPSGCSAATRLHCASSETSSPSGLVGLTFTAGCPTRPAIPSAGAHEGPGA